MKTYEEYKKLAVKELTGKFPEEIEEEMKKRDPNTVYINTYSYYHSDLNSIISNMVITDLINEVSKYPFQFDKDGKLKVTTEK